jgi:putative phosphonate metabolism protein
MGFPLSDKCGAPVNASPDSRVALYYAPAENDPLWRCGNDWLGRDVRSGERRAQPNLPGIEELTAEPRLYGFHATLKPPLRLRDGVTRNAFLDAAARVAAGVPQFFLPPLHVANLHGFLALREAEPSPALQALADACVAGVDEFRAPPDEAELARRRRNGLPTAQEAMLTRWGYPYVFATWFFHMTLTRRLTPDEHERVRPAAERFFAAALRTPRRVTDICVFTQTEPGAAFLLTERIPLSP